MPAVVTVQKGDTVYALSRRYGVPVKDIIAANALAPPYVLQLGAKVTLPKPSIYVVQRGDTLFSIARGQGVEMKDLAALNNLAPPYGVWIGQRLALPANKPNEPVMATAEAAQPASPPPTSREPEPAPPPPTQTKLPAAGPSPAVSRVTATKPPAPPPRSGKAFAWPVQGKVIQTYGPSSDGTRSDGINIAVMRGAAVRAAENGVVVYSGDELKGFGNLLLVKHDGGWMTAYAHNDSLLVQKGQVVRRGQEIAKAGQSGSASQPQLHFEIRKNGNPLNPMDYLEKAR